MNKIPLDIYDDYPEDMKRYLRHYGWHFNKKACEYAVSLMRKKDPTTGKKVRIQPWEKNEIDTLLQAKNVVLENNTGYDFVYVANMCKADHYKGSVPDETHVASYIKETIDDADAGDGSVMRCWYAKMVANEEVIIWEEFL